ncbi:MAG TPA: cytochrome P450, partial [Acidimicrobiia bacterium]|nr:cytochrome P450 [Acidimicrobiia bacterium]
MTQPAIRIPTDRQRRLDPPVDLAELRGKTPIRRLEYPDGHVGWFVTSHVLARAVLADRRMSIRDSMSRSPVDNHIRREAFTRLAEQGNPRVASGYAGNFLNMDPPDHTRFRRMLASEFTPRRIEGLRPRVVRIVDDQLDLIEAHGMPADLIERYALPIPSLVICEILGVPHDVRDHFQAWSTILEDPRTEPGDLADAYDEFTRFMYDLVHSPDDLPSDGLIPRLADAGDLTTDEVVGVGVLLVAAGHQTVANMIGLSVYALLADRRRWDLFRTDDGSVASGVEELLRFLTIFQLGALTRTALDDIPIGDVTISAGESVTVSLSAANRDPEMFSDPTTLDLLRNASGHVAFGHGIHVCIGQHLARVELEASLTGLASRFPELDLAVPFDEVPMHPDHESQAGLEAL